VSLKKNLRDCILHKFEELAISRQSCRDYCEEHGGKLLILLSGFRPKIRPQARQINECTYKVLSIAQFFFHCIL
jgi:hypothetical protein